MPTVVNGVIAAISKRSVLLGGLGLLAVGGAAFGGQALSSTLSRAIDDVGEASRAWLWLAALCFATSLACLAGAWRSALRLCDGHIGFRDAYARYGVGCLVGSLLPGGLGGATRVALYARTLEGEDRAWRVGGSAVLVSVAKTTGVGLLVAYAAMSGAVPRWPLAIVLGLGVATAAACFYAKRHAARGHIGHALDAYRALAAAPRRALELGAWALGTTAARVGAATAIVAAFGVHHPISAALIIIPALAVASCMPLTPANVGLASGAVMVALHSRGVDGTTALAAGIALNGVETVVGITIGVLGLTHLAWQDARRRTVFALTGSTGLALFCALGATFWL